MEIQLNRIDDNYLFECTNTNGAKVILDNVRGENPQGVSPMENLLMCVAGCSSIDIIHILKKQRQVIQNFSAKVNAKRANEGDAKPFEHIDLVFFLQGDIEYDKALRAVALSFEKYCSVSKSLNPNISIGFEVYVNGNKV